MEEIDEQTDDMGGIQAKQIFLKAKKTMFQTEEKTVLIHSTKRLGVFSGSSDGEESACNAGDLGSIPGSGISWRRECRPTLAFLSGDFHGQRSLVGYSPCGLKE